MKFSFAVCSLTGLMTASHVSSATVSSVTLTKLLSPTLPGNLLPQFLFQQGSIEGGSVGVTIGGGRGTAHKFTPDDSVGEDIFEGAMEDMRSPQLPYLSQDQWGCERYGS